jgi:hypothetical protein
MLISQTSFNAWAYGATPRARFAITALMLLMVALCSAAVLIMGPRLVREGTLLWFGTWTEGVVQQVSLAKVGTFRSGDPKYQLTIDYRFAASDGIAYTGTTVRGDVGTPPSFDAGDRIGVYYESGNPSNSVAEHNLRPDVYGLLFFLPFLGVIGIAAPALYLRCWWIWRRQRSSPRSGH